MTCKVEPDGACMGKQLTNWMTIGHGVGAVVLVYASRGAAQQTLGVVQAEPIAVVSSTIVDRMSSATMPVASAVLPDAWWTGPIAASSAETLPHNHILFEPYVFDVRGNGSDYAGSLTYILYGVTDRLTVGAIPTFGSAKTHVSTQPRRLGVGESHAYSPISLQSCQGWRSRAYSRRRGAANPAMGTFRSSRAKSRSRHRRGCPKHAGGSLCPAGRSGERCARCARDLT